MNALYLYFLVNKCKKLIPIISPKAQTDIWLDYKWHAQKRSNESASSSG